MRKKVLILILILSILLVFCGCGSKENVEKDELGNSIVFLNKNDAKVENQYLRFEYDDNIFTPITGEIYANNKVYFDDIAKERNTTIEQLYGNVLVASSSIALLLIDDDKFLTQITYNSATSKAMGLLSKVSKKDKVLDKMLKSLVEELPGGAKNIHTEIKQIGGEEACIVTYDGVDYNNPDTELKSVRVALNKGESLHIFIFNALKDNYEKHLNYFDEILESVEFR